MIRDIDLLFSNSVKSNHLLVEMVFLTKHFVQDTMANIELIKLVTLAIEGCVIEYALYKILPFFINFSGLITIKGIDYQSLCFCGI